MASIRELWHNYHPAVSAVSKFFRRRIPQTPLFQQNRLDRCIVVSCFFSSFGKACLCFCLPDVFAFWSEKSNFWRLFCKRGQTGPYPFGCVTGRFECMQRRRVFKLSSYNIIPYCTKAALGDAGFSIFHKIPSIFMEDFIHHGYGFPQGSSSSKSSGSLRFPHNAVLCVLW